MRKPLAVNTPINTTRYKGWTDLFGSYRSGVTNTIIQSWLDQFDDADKDLAARTLDSVLYFGQAQIADNYRSMLKALQGWHQDKNKRKGRWFFVAMSVSAGESGDGMLYHFRLANNLDAKRYNEVFISPSELVSKKLTNEDTVVLLDDFSGTGQQVCEAWNDSAVSYSELVAGAGKVYLILIAATKQAHDRIVKETSLALFSGHYLNNKDNIFSDACTHFTKDDKKKLLKYNTIADGDKPKGRGDCGLLIVFSHRCPNNTIPILHVQNTRWTAVFPRHE